MANFDLAARVGVFDGTDDDDRFTFSDVRGDGVADPNASRFVFAGNGNDRVEAGPGSDIITGGAGNDSLFGNGGDDEIEGGDGDDVVDGGDGNDTLRGGNGNDNINGGDGADVIRAGGGNDNIDLGQNSVTQQIGPREVRIPTGPDGDADVVQFHFSDGVDSPFGATRDIVSVFEVGTDKIDLTAYRDVEITFDETSNANSSFFKLEAGDGAPGQQGFEPLFIQVNTLGGQLSRNDFIFNDNADVTIEEAEDIDGDTFVIEA